MTYCEALSATPCQSKGYAFRRDIRREFIGVGNRRTDGTGKLLELVEPAMALRERVHHHNRPADPVALRLVYRGRRAVQKLVAQAQDVAIRETQGLPKNRQPRFLVRRGVFEPFRDELPEGLVHLALDPQNREVRIIITDESQQVRLARAPRSAKIGLLLERIPRSAPRPGILPPDAGPRPPAPECLSLLPTSVSARRPSILSSSAAPASRDAE